MSLNLNNIPGGGGKKFAPQTNITPGGYPGRVVQLIHLGLQPQRPFKGVDKPPAQELMVTYELVDEFMKDEEGKDIEDKPRWISETFPLHSLDNEKARSTQRYHVFDPTGDVLKGDITQIINLPCLVTVVNNASGDKVYDNVGNVSAMRPRDAMQCPELKNPTKVFLCDEPDIEVFKSLPKWIQEKITGNLNFQGSKLQKLIGGEVQKVENPAKEPAKEESSNNPY